MIAGPRYDLAPTEALRLAVESGCLAYNSHYGALARQLDASLVTHDTELLERFPDTAVHPKDFLVAGN